MIGSPINIQWLLYIADIADSIFQTNSFNLEENAFIHCQKEVAKLDRSPIIDI